MTPSAERKNPSGGQPPGSMGTAERNLDVPKFGAENKSCRETYDEHRAKEYGWINLEGCQKLSDDLDKAVRQIGGTYWRNMIAEYGREAAARELDERRFCFEQGLLRREQQAKLDEAAAPLRAFQEENRWYLVCDRFWPVTSEAAFNHVQKMDAAFIEEQKASGFSTEELEQSIALLQKENLEYIKWQLEKTRRQREAEAEKRRLKDEADQRQAEEFAKAVRVEAERLVKEIIVSGVFRGK